MPLLTAGLLLFTFSQSTHVLSAYDMPGHTVNTTNWPLAVCMNGEAPRYFVGKEPGAATDKQGWVFFMEGGGWCSSEKECHARQQGSLGKPLSSETLDSRRVHLPLDVVVEMRDYTRVYLHYCSGDVYAGDAKVGSLHMRGRRIVEAVLDELLTKHGMDSASIVVLNGQSAGGVGTFFNADYIANKVSLYGIKAVAVPVGGMFLHPAFEFEASMFGRTVEQFSGEFATTMTWQNQTRDSSCCDVYGNDGPGRFECTFFDRLAQYIEVPTFLVYNRWDNHKGWMLPLTTITNKAKKKGAIKEWGDIHERYFKQLIDGELPGIDKNRAEQFGFFHASCMAHAHVPPGALVDGTSMGEAIGAWFRAQLKRWDLPGGKWEEPSKYQLIADAPGRAGMCSISCCDAECSQHTGCSEDQGHEDGGDSGLVVVSEDQGHEDGGNSGLAVVLLILLAVGGCILFTRLTQLRQVRMPMHSDVYGAEGVAMTTGHWMGSSARDTISTTGGDSAEFNRF